MQKYLPFLLVILLFISCNSSSKTKGSDEKDLLTVTIEPQRYFLEQIAGDTYKINTLVPPGTSPETYEPAPSVMLNMAKSKIYFKVGDLGFERAWSTRLAENNPDVLIVDCSEGIDLMIGHQHIQSDSHDNQNHETQSGENNTNESMDPHVWSSPKAVKIFSKNMLDALISAYPKNEEMFRINFDRFMAKVDSTDSLISNVLKDMPGRAFMIYHPALSYFANDYNLHQHSIEFEGKNPSPAQIRELVDVARKENINTLFMQKGFDKKNAEVIASEVGTEVFDIDPLNYNWDEELIRIAKILSREE
ncbi:MAG TPA: zinc ABC transporter substrate-binding protein [Porphyromonadaceae bacterium]|jgi:zinc transport system substrate-binding protein|nr:zinc ABC transporter substrate-binding protein [Porphyromonadaceae bacterium]